MSPIITALGNACKALASIFGYAQQRDGEKNAPEMKANAAAKTAAATADQAAGDVKVALDTGDLAQLRKDAAE
jgi:hypothetical protein